MEINNDVKDIQNDNLMKASDYNGWKDTLLTILAKHGKSPTNVVNYYGQTVNQGEPTLSTQIGTIRSDIINSSQALCHVPSITELDVGDFSKGSPTLLDTKTKIEAKLAEMNSVCHHDSNLSNNSNWGEHSDHTITYVSECTQELFISDDYSINGTVLYLCSSN